MSSSNGSSSSKRGVRILILLLVLVGAGVAVTQFGSSSEPEGTTTASNGGVDPEIGVDPIDIEPDLPTTPGGLTGANSEAATFGDITTLLEHDRGTPVESGTSVPVGVTYRPGTTTRYRVMSLTYSKDRGREQISALRMLEGWTVHVAKARKNGGWSLEVSRPWFKYQSLGGVELTFEYDSRAPDPAILERFGTMLKPLEALNDVGYVVLLDAQGRVERVKGVEEARKRYQEALVRLNVPGVEQHGLIEEEQAELFRTWFFPTIGGKTITAGEPLPFTLRLNSGLRHWVKFTGKLDATHSDDDSFCVALGSTEAGASNFGGSGTLPDGRSLMGFRVPPVKDGVSAEWVFDRARGRLRSTRIHPKYPMWVVFHPTTGTEPERFFMDMEQLITVDVVDEDDGGSSNGDSEETGSTESGADPASAGNDPAAGEENGRAR